MSKSATPLSLSTLATWAAAAALVAAWSPAQALSTVARTSNVQVDGFALNPNGCATVLEALMGQATSSSVSSLADLSVSGSGCYQDSFGRHYTGTYAAEQDVTFGPSMVQVQMGQVLDINVISEGFPAARAPSLTATNQIDLELSFSGPTTLQIDVLYLGDTANFNAWDFVRLGISASFNGLPAGGLFDLNASGAQSGVPFSTLVTFNPVPGYQYFLGARSGARANADENFASALQFTVTAVPEPGAWAMMASGLAFMGWMGRRQRSRR